MKRYNSEKYLVKELRTKDYKQIAEENGVSFKTINRKMREFGFTNPSLKWSQKEIDLLKEEYPINPNVYSLFPNRTIISINHKASRFKLKKDIPKRKHKVNSFFFKKWSEDMAYILGWFYSDGCVSSNTNCCSIHLHVKDVEILRKIRKAMDSTHLLEIYNNSVNFRIYDFILKESLIKLGCVPRKSLKIKFPNIPEEYLSHFVRGYFDGDGSIHFNQPNTVKVSFAGSEYFIRSLQKVLNEQLGLRVSKTGRNSGIWRCLYYGNDARKLCRWMYEDTSGLFLGRKKERFDNHLNLRGERFVNGKLQTSYIG